MAFLMNASFEMNMFLAFDRRSLRIVLDSMLWTEKLV